MTGGAHHPKVLPAHMYRDPAKFTKFPSETACKGCRHEVTAWGKTGCDLGKPHGKRCKRFKTGDAK